MGGIVVWGSVVLTILCIAGLASFLPTFESLNFLSRNQTWLPFATLVIGALVGLSDDLMVIRENAEGLRLRYRILIVIVLSTLIGWWFFYKLDITAVNIPYFAPLELGWLIIPLFVLVSLALYASGVIDGIDGLSGVGIAVLPLIGGLLVVTVLSDVAQILSKRFFGRKLLRIAPLHHHFEAIGWPGHKVVMRYWVLSIVLAFAGVMVALSASPVQ